MRLAILAALGASLGCATGSRTKGGNPVASFGPAGITAEAARPLRHALLVGIDDFQDARFTGLKHAAADAGDLGRALSDFDDVKVLARPELTSRAAILEELAALEARVRTPGDTVVLFFSTHGSLAREPGGELKRYLVAADTRMDLMAETGLAVDALIRKADASRSRRILLVLAACHSGKGKSQLPDELARALASSKAGAPPPLEDVSEAVIVLTAAAFGESAREDDGLGHDVYTHFLLRALEEGDRDGDGAVTASEAHDYARERTYAFTGGAQRPTSESSLLGRDPIVLRGQPLRVGSPVVYSYAPSAEGIAVELNGVKKGTLPGGIALSPGSYRLRLTDARGGNVLYSGSVDISPGEYLDLSRLVRRGLQPRGELGLGALIPVSRAARSVLPAMPMAVLRAGERHVLRDWLRAELEVGVASGAGDDTALAAARVPFRAYGAQLGVAALGELPLGKAFMAAAGVGAGLFWLARDYQGSFSGHESLRATSLSAQVELSFLAGERLSLGARLSALSIFGTLAASPGPHLALLPTLNAGFSF